MFRHPKYYKELKEFGKRGDRGKPTAASPDTDQAISDSVDPASGVDSVRPGPGHKLQAREDSTANSTRGQVAEPQASSVKHQAPEASSHKPQAPSSKRQA